MNKKHFNKFLKIFSIILLVFIIIFIIYVSDYYKSSDEALKLLNNSNILVKSNYIEIKNESDIGFIFYPGGKVEYTSYLPFLTNLNNYGFNIFLVNMPFNLAVFNINAADNIIKNNSNIDTWIISGHSLGGIMASNYASNNQDKIDNLILLGSYNYNNFPLEKTLTIYGEHDLLTKDSINYSKNVVMIEGGNHAYFGNYGNQKGDGIATISNSNQQDLTINEIIKFLKAD